MPPTSGELGPERLVDTSVAVALSIADHEGRAAFETFSVLTRLPAPARRTTSAVTRLLTANFPHSRMLGAQAAAALFTRRSRS